MFHEARKRQQAKAGALAADAAAVQARAALGECLASQGPHRGVLAVPMTVYHLTTWL
jgi:hypothetical protein